MNKLYLLTVLLISTAVKASEPSKPTREELLARLEKAKQAAQERSDKCKGRRLIVNGKGGQGKGTVRVGVIREGE